MKTADFTTSILVDQSPKAVFDAINNVGEWWPGEVTGDSHKVNDEFEYRVKDIHYSKHKVVEVEPEKKVVWLVTDSKLNFTNEKTEWTGTKNIFDISEKDGKTLLRFTHAGLVPKFECYKDCSNGWRAIIQDSLYSFITTGKGKMDLFD
jgi:hypothetical protein